MLKVRQFECKRCGRIFWVNIEPNGMWKNQGCKNCGAMDIAPVFAPQRGCEACGPFPGKDQQRA
jgi:transcription elongation factor Elf1